MKLNKLNLGVIGLGYVGLPLAVEFGKKRKVVCYDINHKRIKELKLGIDRNQEVSDKEMKNTKNLIFTDNINDLKNINCFIVSVPTPITDKNKPDLQALLSASRTVAKVLKKGDTVIYESTVYPGCTEEKCVPVLEKNSGLKFNLDFFCGYSPERINPGDKKHRINNIVKVTSGSTKETLGLVDKLYKEIIYAGTHKVSSIKIAEAAKVIENTQRDLNIAFINELSIIFKKLNIDTEEVLRAAETKWNFLSFRPGLVGGHCIGVDPYYLTHKCENIGYRPKIILAGRKINNNMGKYIVSQLIKSMKKKLIKIQGAKVLIMGVTFKENCPDVRNSGVKRIFISLKKHGCNIDLYDPVADKLDVKNFFGLELKKNLKKNFYDAIILAVAHQEIKKISSIKVKSLCKSSHIIYDLKYIFQMRESDLRL